MNIFQMTHTNQHTHTLNIDHKQTRFYGDYNIITTPQQQHHS